MAPAIFTIVSFWLAQSFKRSPWIVACAKADDPVRALLRGAMHRGAAVLGVRGVDVDPGLQQQLDRLDGVSFSFLAAGAVFFLRAESRGCHQGIDALPRRELRIGALLQQETYDRRVAGLGGPQQRRRPRRQHAVGA